MHSVVDLFCGVGGLTHGFVKEGFNVVAGIDCDATCKYAYEHNNGAQFIEKNIEEMSPGDIVGLYPEGDSRVLVGCAPCQPFSRYSNRKSEDTKWQLVARFAELICGVHPHVISMENVPQLIRHPVFTQFLLTLEQEGYHVSYSVVDCVKYGVPQTRHRLVLFASRLGHITIIPPTHRRKAKTVQDAIARLEPIEAGEASTKDPMHRSSALSNLNLRRIRATPAGGGWKDWDDGLVLDCHKKDAGKTYGSVYGRMKWSEPAPTITTQCHGLGNGRFGHPDQDRAISIREAALIQTFPRYYAFLSPDESLTIGRLARHIGNAVPVRLGVIIARTIRKHLEKNHAEEA